MIKEVSTSYIREKYGFTQEMLAETFGISLTTVQKWDNESSMPVYMLYAMSIACDNFADCMGYFKDHKKLLEVGKQMHNIYKNTYK